MKTLDDIIAAAFGLLLLAIALVLAVAWEVGRIAVPIVLVVLALVYFGVVEPGTAWGWQ